MERRETHHAVASGASALIKVPFVRGGLTSLTRTWADAHGAELCELSHDDDAYWRALCSWWQLDGDLVVIEQDMEPAVGVVEEMLECEAGWCSSPYQIEGAGEFGWGLGCVKFSARMRAEHPHAAFNAGVAGPQDPDPPAVWWKLDVRLATQLIGRGVLPHAHVASRHLHAPKGEAA